MVRIKYLIAITLVFISCRALGSTDSIPVNGYRLIWKDEFNGTRLDLRKWNYRGPGKRDDAYNTEKAVSLDGNGHLIIEVSKRSDSIFTGMISTENIFQRRYGYFECRVKLPKTAGIFPSFWLQSPLINTPGGNPENSGAELDIFEYYPHSNTTAVSHGMHWGGYGATHKVEGPVWGPLGQTLDDFHIIGFEWTENSYTIWVDGVQTVHSDKLISKVPEFMILSVGVSALAAGPLNIQLLPDRFVVDYVRVYTKE